MKPRYLLISILLPLFIGAGFKDREAVVQAKLISFQTKDTINYEEIRIGRSQIVDLKFCLGNFNYPPQLSQNIFWTKPETSSIQDYDKFDIQYKYFFDDKGRVVTYFYQGSLISGIFPQLYAFSYDINRPELITEIKDVHHKISYKIQYNDLKSIEWIEKRDSLNIRVEVLEINRK